MTATTPPSGGRELVISHCYAEGTLLTGTRREDDLYRVLRAHGWLYRRSAGDFRLQGSVDKPAKTGAIHRTAQALRERSFAVRVQVDNTLRPVQDAEAALADAAQDRANRLDQRAQRLRAEAQAREAAGRSVLDHIPPGQPYLVDSPGYAADRNRRERAVGNLQRAAQLDTQAANTERAAETAAARMEHRYHPLTVANRIRELEAEHRRLTRIQTQDVRSAELLAAGTPRDQLPTGLVDLSPEHQQQITDRRAWVQEQLQHWQQVRQDQIASGQATHYSRDQIHRGDLIQYRSTWYLVLRTNPKSVTIPSPLGHTTRTVRYEHITDHVQPDSDRWRACLLATIDAAYRYAGASGPHAAIKALADTLT